MMGDMSSNFFLRFWRVVRIPLLVLVVAYVALVIYRIPAVYEKEKTEEAIGRIESTHLEIRDVDGSRLPPRPNEARNNETIAGIDANNNKIRDDVELVIFERYPGKENEKIRAALLQYAMGLQLYLTEVFNEETWDVVSEQSSRGYQCISLSMERPDPETASDEEINSFFQRADLLRESIKELVLNNRERTEAFDRAFDFITSTSVSTESYCDVF